MAIELTSPSDVARNAYFSSFSKAQADARSINTDPSSSEYFEAMVASLKHLGWVFIEADSYHANTVSKPDTPIAIALEAFLHFTTQAFPFLPVTYQQLSEYLPTIYDALDNAPADTVKALDQWWSESQVSGSVRLFTMGPLFKILQAPVTVAAHISMTFKGDSWRSLIHKSDSIELQAAPLAAVLNLDVYNTFKSQLEADLHASVVDHITTATLDFGITDPK